MRFQCDADGVAVCFDSVVDVFGITASHRRGNRQATVAAHRNDELITTFQSVQRQFQSAQPIPLKSLPEPRPVPEPVMTVAVAS